MRSCKIWVGCCIIMLLHAGNTCYAQNADIDLLRHINLTRQTGRDKALHLVSESVYGVAAAAPVAELVAGYAADNAAMRRAGWQAVGGLAVNTLLVTGLKYSINRARPYNTYTDIHAYKVENDPSFPSGHTSYAFCMATSLTISFPEWYVAVPAYAYAGVAGYTRMALGEHYPTDVLAGAVVGCGSAWLSWKGNQWLQHRKSLNHDSHD